MGSRYDVAVFRNVDLADFRAAFMAHGSVGDDVPEASAGPTGIAVAQIDTNLGTNVIVDAPPMKMPRGVDTGLAHQLGAEVLLATVWDSVSMYSLTVVGNGVDRYLSFEPDDDEAETKLYQSGDRLPEEPSWTELDEAYVQVVFEARCGIDPGNLRKYDVPWYSLEPQSRPPRPGPRRAVAIGPLFLV